MAVLIDPPAWPAHGRLWSHLVSDVSYDELHDFADAVGVPRRAFEGDHYDVPQERYAGLVAAGAREVSSRDLLRALQRSGLRVPKRKGERVLRTWRDGRWLTTAGAHHVDVIASALGPPPESTFGTRLFAVRSGRVALVDGDLPAASGAASGAARDAATGRPVGHLRARFDGPRVTDELPWPRAHLALRAVAPGELDGASATESGAVTWADVDEATPRLVTGYWWPLLERLLRG